MQGEVNMDPTSETKDGAVSAVSAWETSDMGERTGISSERDRVGGSLVSLPPHPPSCPRSPSLEAYAANSIPPFCQCWYTLFPSFLFTFHLSTTLHLLSLSMTFTFSQRLQTPTGKAKSQQQAPQGERVMRPRVRGFLSNDLEGPTAPPQRRGIPSMMPPDEGPASDSFNFSI